MENKQIANILYETADLLEVSGADPFRVRSYRRAAESIAAWHEPLSRIRHDEKAILAIPGIGKGMLANLRDLFNTGELGLHRELLKRFRPSMLELLRIPGLGPKTVALIFDAFQVSDLAGVEELAKQGKLQTLPRISAKTEQKILHGIAEYRRSSGRHLLYRADRIANEIIGRLKSLPGVDRVTAAGSLRRGLETVGDLDILVTGDCCKQRDQLDHVINEVVELPGVFEVVARGDNKVTLKLREGMQVDVRILEPQSFGAALQYFTGSKAHNVALRQRALKMGYTLSEYALAKLPDAGAPKEGPKGKGAAEAEGEIIASASEEEIYRALKLEFIPPELRENRGEIEAAANNALPKLIEQSDIRGDLHAHTVATDGRNTIAEMAKAARALGYEYCAITDHSKNLAMVNGLDDRRAMEHIKQIRAVDKQMEGAVRVFAGIECDILGDGALDLSHDVLDEIDIVIASVHSHFKQSPEQMTERIIRAISSGKVNIIAHPFGRLILRREGYTFDLDAVLAAAREYGVAMEHNSYPDRLDLSEEHLRIAKSRGVKIVIDTDAHSTFDYTKMKYGVAQLRRAWLTKEDVLNTKSAKNFLASFGRKR